MTHRAALCAGVYNEVAFQALDRLIADAGQRGIKLIITMTDNWHLQDGLQQVCCSVHLPEQETCVVDRQYVQSLSTT